MSKKVFVILPDGIGLKNFGFSQFSNFLNDQKIEAIYWNRTPFDLHQLNLSAVPLFSSIPFRTDLLKRAKIDLELDDFSNKFKNEVYQSYKFPSKPKTLKAYIKNQIVKFFKFYYRSNLKGIQVSINKSIRNSKSYNLAIAILEKEKPSLVFCTNQRASNAIAPILAAKSLNIPTACFIFSWDNLPKATKVVETDYYFVWSEYMQEELIHYYPEINRSQIKITGTPQFEPHFSLTDLQIVQFRKKYNIKKDVKYILFSGDDVTTSPKDEYYFESVCQAVESLNKRAEENIEIIFRRCPVDFSKRYDEIIEKYSSLVTEIKPGWKKQGEAWNTILPRKEDLMILANTVKASDLVINLGSSMVFDAVCHKKPTAYINFDPIDLDLNKWSVKKIYGFIHFQSMPDKDAVIWLTSKDEMEDKILEGLTNPKPYVQNAQEWFSIINKQPSQEASKRIAEALNEIISKK